MTMHQTAKEPLMKALLWRSTALLVLVLLLAGCGTGDSAVQDNDSQTASDTGDSTTGQRDTETGDVFLPGRLLFVQDGVIWLWEGEERSRLIGQGEAWQPSWSSNGRRIVYIERGESYSDVLVADALGNTLEQLTNNESDAPLHSHERIYDSMWALYPIWSPDNTRIALASQYAPPTGSPAFEYNLGLYTIPADGGRRVQIYADDRAHFGQMTYTPDGTELIYTWSSSTQDGLQQLYRLSLAYGASAPYPGAPLRSYDPAFSPDGEWLAFASREDDRTDIWVLPGNAAEGSNPVPQRLTSIGTARAPAFSPDGSLLAFLAIPPDGQGFELWVAELSLQANGVLQASEPRQITSDMHLDADSGLSWAL